MQRQDRSFLKRQRFVGIGLAFLTSSVFATGAIGSDARQAGPRWQLQHGRELQATIGLSHSPTARALPAGPQARLDDVRFEWPDGAPVDFETYRKALSVDGFLVLKDGKVVFERYYDGFGPRATHNWASMSKSIVGVLALRLAKQGVIDLDAPLGRYVPELAETPFGGATVQQNLNMRVSVTYPKALPPDLGLFAAAGLAPVPPGAPANIHDFLKAALPGEGAHGANFFYQNGSTEAVAWALERASNTRLADLVEQQVWTPMGAAEDGYYLLDRNRTAFAAGGVSSTLRDLARFGELVRTGLDPAIAKRLQGWDDAPSSVAEGFHYRDFWWHGHHGVFALGRFGQRLAVIPDKHIVIAQFAAYEDERPRATSTEAATKKKDPDLRDGEAFQALAQAIAARF